MISPILYFIGVETTNVTVFVLFYLIFLSFLRKKKINAWFYYVATILFVFSFVPVLKWGLDVKYGFVTILPLTSLLLLIHSDKKEIEAFLHIATILLFIILLSAYYGFFLYNFFGVKPVEYPYLHKEILFLDTTFVSYSYGMNIRPAGIYDEPGAFSFVICSIVLGRSILGLSDKLSWALLLLGFITFSLAHMIFVVLFAINSVVYKRQYYLIILFFVIFVAISYYIMESQIGKIFDDLLIGRLSYDDEYLIAGNNRGIRFLNSIKYIDFDVIMFGLDGRLFYDYQNVYSEYNVFGENILTPLISKGIFSSFLYYIVLILLFIIPLRNKKYFLLFAMLLMIIQRPYVTHNPGYSFLIFLPLVLYFNIKSDCKH